MGQVLRPPHSYRTVPLPDYLGDRGQRWLDTELPDPGVGAQDSWHTETPGLAEAGFVPDWGSGLPVWSRAVRSPIRSRRRPKPRSCQPPVAPAHRGHTQATFIISEAHCSFLAQLQGRAPPRLSLPPRVLQHPGQGLPGAYGGASRGSPTGGPRQPPLSEPLFPHWLCGVAGPEGKQRGFSMFAGWLSAKQGGN